MKNYKVDFSNSPHKELVLLSKRGLFNTWRVYFDTFEHEEERKESIIIVKEPVTTTKIEKDPITGEDREVEVTEEIEKEVKVETRVYESKYFDVPKNKEENPTALSLIKEQVLQEITDYDLSEKVNCFSLNGTKVWLDKDTRVGLMNSTMIQKNAGMKETVLWLDTTPLKIECDLAIQLLDGLEIYALDCFNKTAEHKRNIELSNSVEEIANYDYTVGYPEQLNLLTV